MKSEISNIVYTATLQKPLNSGFSAASTASEVIADIDLSGKVAIVTGGYSGIGLETVRAFHSAGAKIIVPARDRAKANRTLDRIDGIEIWALDLLDPDSIDGFADRFLATGQPLHILVNSAGIMASPLMRDSRGYEAQFSTNHLGHFQLTSRLWPALSKANGARVVAVSSRGHRYSPVVFDDIQFQHREYDPMQAYGQSKTANILFAMELDKRGWTEGIRAFSVHPGSILDTDLGRYSSKERFRKLGFIDEQGSPVLDPLRQLKTVEQGASTSVWCATSSLLKGKGGVYCENNDIASIVTNPVPLDSMGGADDKGNFGVMPNALDPQVAERLWQVSEQLVFGRSFSQL